jgi:LL-diaminopimelate aminotransferase
MPLLEGTGFLPDLGTISDLKAKMMFLNYPNNPTGAVADKDFLKGAIDFASDNGTILCYDNAYSEVTYGDYVAPSILEVDGAANMAIEFHSCSKTFSMTGDRIAFAVGNSKLIDGLIKVKTQIDSGPSKYIQYVAMRGLRSYVRGRRPADVERANATYQDRCKILVEGLRAAGLQCQVPRATFYIWVKCGGDSTEFSRKLLGVGVVATPGVGFGEYGEGYLRFSVTQPTEDIKKACERMVRIKG